jgi:hypothetical protein
MDPRELRAFSPMTWVLERCFHFAQYLSPANVLFGTRVDSQRGFTTSEARRERTISRGRQIELYVLCWLVVELCVASAAPSLRGYWGLLLILLAFRVFDILQSVVNLNVFDCLRLGVRTHYVATLARTLLLSFWNFFELLLCFGAFYSSPVADFDKVVSAWDAYYFSVITQLTIGYGDIQPLSYTRVAAALQGLCGFTLALFALSRLVAFLPRTEPVLHDE